MARSRDAKQRQNQQREETDGRGEGSVMGSGTQQHGSVRKKSKCEGEVLNHFVKQGITGLCFMVAALVITILFRQLGISGPSWEAIKTATSLLAGLGWYAMWWPRPGRNLGIRFLLVIWLAVALSWIAVVVSSVERRQVVMESMAMGFTVFVAEMTYRRISRPQPNDPKSRQRTS
ncbi:MAG: hypothetical protein D8M22_01845 [Armatimonadetes bacterium]|nr:hypothetical protein [Armatimonadota bacterium]